MKPERALNVLIVLDVVLTFSVIGVELFFNWTLPRSLQRYVQSESWWLPTNASLVVLFLLWASSILTTLAAWVGLLSRWWFARRLYVIAWASWLALLLFSGPSVLNPVGAFVTTLEALVAGAIFGLIFFSDLARHFERRPATIPNGAPVPV